MFYYPNSLIPGTWKALGAVVYVDVLTNIVDMDKGHQESIVETNCADG
jgi:hypothetical protein